MFSSSFQSIGKFRTSSVLFLVSYLCFAVALFSGFMLLRGSLHPTEINTGDSPSNVLSRQVMALTTEQLHTGERIAALSKTLAELRAPQGKYTSLQPSDREALNRVIEGQKSLDTRLKALENALTVDASKALSVPLMRKDLDTFQETAKTDTVLVQNEINRLFGLVQWFIGIMFTILVGFFGLAVTNMLLRAKEMPKPQTDTPIK